jgi:hypothetical protein
MGRQADSENRSQYYWLPIWAKCRKIFWFCCRSKDYGLNQSELHQVAAACWWKNGQKPSINDFSNT